MSSTDSLVRAARDLRDAVASLSFKDAAFIYNPLDYAWAPHEAYLRRYGHPPKRVVFMGMNPGPFGMAQTGVPFGEIAMVRDWMGINEPVSRPANEHPKRPVQGFDCQRSEVSGRRLWGLFADCFGSPENFFRDHFVLNYCPLVFMGETGRNSTPDKLQPAEAHPLHALCDEHLRAAVRALQPEWLIGVGKFAEGRARHALDGMDVRIGTVLHPSPASPAANRGWAEAAQKQLRALGAW